MSAFLQPTSRRELEAVRDGERLMLEWSEVALTLHFCQSDSGVDLPH